MCQYCSDNNDASEGGTDHPRSIEDLFSNSQEMPEEVKASLAKLLGMDVDSVEDATLVRLGDGITGMAFKMPVKPTPKVPTGADMDSQLEALVSSGGDDIYSKYRQIQLKLLEMEMYIGVSQIMATVKVCSHSGMDKSSAMDIVEMQIRSMDWYRQVTEASADSMIDLIEAAGDEFHPTTLSELGMSIAQQFTDESKRQAGEEVADHLNGTAEPRTEEERITGYRQHYLKSDPVSIEEVAPHGLTQALATGRFFSESLLGLANGYWDHHQGHHDN